MKSALILLLCMSVFSIRPANAQIKSITFNIRYGLADDGDNSWIHRNHLVFRFINDEDADFVGLQEALLFQIDEILENCPQYEFVGRTREIHEKEGEATPILYQPDRWELLDHNTLWLSETPDVPGSGSWNTALPRIFTWARFKNKKDEKEILIYNTHYDHISARARFNSSKTIISFMEENHKNEDIILLGDFNALETDDPVKYIAANERFSLTDAYRHLHPSVHSKDATFYGWQEHVPGSGKRIDYIFFRGNLYPFRVYVGDYNDNGRYPSDHMPVVAVFN